MPELKRRIKLIRPRLQLKLIGCFVGLTAVALLLQNVLMGRALSRAAADLEDAPRELLEGLPGVQLRALLFGILFVLPIVVGFGVLLTFRVAGLVYRFGQFLAKVARGEQVQPCRIRRDDELHTLCEAINAATSEERARAAERENRAVAEKLAREQSAPAEGDEVALPV